MRSEFLSTLLLISSAVSGVLHAQSSGQNYTISPYSNFGLGEVLQQNFAQSGGAGQTFTGSYSYSLQNPATLANLRYTAFDFGLNYRYSLIQTQSAVQSFNGGSLSYLSLAFKVLNKNIPRFTDSAGFKKRTGTYPLHWNSYFAVYPSTSVGYNFTVEGTDPFINRTYHSGKGGLNSFEWGNGITLGNHLSIGFSFSYKFGQISDESVFIVPDSDDFYRVYDNKSVNIRGYQNRLGLLYQFKVDSTYHRIGLSFGNSLGTHATDLRFTKSYQIENGVTTAIDTLINQTGTPHSIQLPGSFGVGYYFRWRKKWAMSLDYSSERWSNYSSFFQQNQKLANRQDMSFSFFLNPMDEKESKHKKMPVPMQLGARYAHTQNVFTIDGNKVAIDETNLFCGFGIPFTRRYFDNQVLRSMINIRFDYIQRGTLTGGLAKETYYVTTLGFNLGDVWFQRRKFD